MKMIETIKVEFGRAYNLEYHNLRLNRTREELFALKSKIDLRDYLPKLPRDGLYRLRVVYSKEIEKVEIFSYKKKIPFHFAVVNFEDDYSYKYLNRDSINRLKEPLLGVDEVILLKNGKIGDTSIANIALLIDGLWITPKNPILAGTTRERYLESGFLLERELDISDLERAERMALLNAMVDFMPLDRFEIELSF